jgi:hypothetical protein
MSRKHEQWWQSPRIDPTGSDQGIRRARTRMPSYASSSAAALQLRTISATRSGCG